MKIEPFALPFIGIAAAGPVSMIWSLLMPVFPTARPAA
jgi:hypothetical protein